MPRILWKGAISFGLIHVPVALYPASKQETVDLDWLDDRTMQPVGYRRINKETREEVDKQHIARGFQYETGRYVVLSDEEIKAANVKSTQTVDIQAFVDVRDIPFFYLKTPYYLAPTQRGEKVYVLLREALRRVHKAGLALVVIQTKQYLAAVFPLGPVLVLNTLRWATEIRSFDELNLPKEDAKAAGISDRELTMAADLVEEMAQPWDPTRYRDTFRDDLMALVDRKIKAGQTEAVAAPPPDDQESRGADIIDLTALLKRSLRDRGTRRSTEESTPSVLTARRKRVPRKASAMRRRA